MHEAAAQRQLKRELLEG